MKLEKVAVLGAGAVGAYVLWGLSEKPGIRLGVVAEGERARRLQNGIGINGKAYHPEVWTPEEAHGADLLIVALKYGALPGALDSIRQVVGEHTIVMSLMNGVDSEEILAAEVGADHLLYSLIKVVSHKEADGFRFDPDTTLGIIYGELQEPCRSDRVQAVAELFAAAGLHARVTEHIREEMWSKFRLNVCNNLPQAILGAGVGCYQDSVHMKAISDGLRAELETIAAAKGIDLRLVEASSRHGSAVPPTASAAFFTSALRSTCTTARLPSLAGYASSGTLSTSGTASAGRVSCFVIRFMERSSFVLMQAAEIPGQRELREQDRRQAVFEVPVARFVVPDTHPENGSHAAAEDSEQKERLFRHAARALHLAPRLVPAVDGEGQHIDGKQIDDERCRATRNEYRRQAVRSADHAERKRSAHRSSFASSTAAAAPRRALLNTS